MHCWEMLLRILTDTACHGILLDIGMPVEHNQNRYNWYDAIITCR